MIQIYKTYHTRTSYILSLNLPRSLPLSLPQAQTLLPSLPTIDSSLLPNKVLSSSPSALPQSHTHRPRPAPCSPLSAARPVRSPVSTIGLSATPLVRRYPETAKPPPPSTSSTADHSVFDSARRQRLTFCRVYLS